MLRARLFGGLRVEVGGREVPPAPGLRPRSLLAYLLLHPGPHPRARLAGRFWPDVLDTSARASLRSALWAVRESLAAAGGEAYLHADRTHVGLAPGLPREVDAERFAALAEAGDAASLEEAVALADGPLLPDLADEWVLEEQDRHRDRLIAVLERLAALAEEAGDLPAAVRWTRAALEHDRLREGVHRALMRRLAAAGDGPQALAEYVRLRDALAAELGMRPSDETRALARAIRDEAGAQAAPGAAPADPRARAAAAFVGRAEERAALAGAWRTAAAGRGGLVVLEAPAGLGKTRLLRDLARAVHGAGGREAVGGALDLDGAPPLAPWSEALRPLALAAPAPPPGAGWPADLARLVPAVEAAWGVTARDPSPLPELERARTWEAVVALLAWSSSAAPVLLGLEDLHRADAASVALLAHVGRRLAELPVLVVATRRPAPPAPALDAALAAVDAAGALRARLVLAPLQEEEIARLVARAEPGLDEVAAREVVAAAAGNPLLAREAGRAAAAGRAPADGLRDWVRGPLRSLAGDARTLADLAAAGGRPLEMAEAADLVGAGQLADAVDECVAAGLLEVAGRRVGFGHDLVREACYAELGAPRALAAHARLAEVLARRPGRRAAEVARHLRRADDGEGAARWLAEAAQEARALGALDEGAAYLAEAAGLAAGDPAREAELWLDLADLHAWRADLAAMEEAAGRARALMEARGDEAGLALLDASRSRWLRTTLCVPAESLAASRAALERIDDARLAAPEARLLALGSAAWSESVAGDPAAVPAIVRAVRAMPEAMGDRGLEAELELARGTALIRAGDHAGAQKACEGAAELARLASRPDLAALALLTAASAAACAGDVAHVVQLADRLDTWPWPGVSLEAQMRAARAHALARLGRHEAARDAAAANVRRAEGGSERDRALAELDMGEVLLAAGAPDAARHLRAALDAPDGGIPRALARLRLAEALAAGGDVAGAEAELGQVPFEPAGAADMPEALVPRIAGVQAAIAAARGDRALAARRLDEAVAGWVRLAGGAPAGDAYAAVLVDLGRPPVAGLVEPDRERRAALAAREALGAGEPVP